jgi:hypothetical protein
MPSPVHVMDMSFHTLSPELIEEIASYLHAQDLAAVVLSCRQFFDVVDGSLLVWHCRQYTCHTELVGVYNLLVDLCAISCRQAGEASTVGSIVDRLRRYPFFLWNAISSWLTCRTNRSASAADPCCSIYIYINLCDALRTAQHL